jgi:hypothetical protein
MFCISHNANVIFGKKFYKVIEGPDKVFEKYVVTTSYESMIGR